MSSRVDGFFGIKTNNPVQVVRTYEPSDAGGQWLREAYHHMFHSGRTQQKTDNAFSQSNPFILIQWQTHMDNNNNNNLTENQKRSTFLFWNFVFSFLLHPPLPFITKVRTIVCWRLAFAHPALKFLTKRHFRYPSNRRLSACAQFIFCYGYLIWDNQKWKDDHR